MDDLQPGSVLYLGPHENVPFPKYDPVEKGRLDSLRLECLKLAQTERECRLVPTEPNTLIGIARELFDFVTDAPKRPDLFAVRRMDAAVAEDDLGPRNYLNISGCYVSWGFEAHAFRFRSRAEAEAAIDRHVIAAFNGLGGVALVVPLPSYMDPF